MFRQLIRHVAVRLQKIRYRHQPCNIVTKTRTRNLILMSSKKLSSDNCLKISILIHYFIVMSKRNSVRIWNLLRPPLIGGGIKR